MQCRVNHRPGGFRHHNALRRSDAMRPSVVKRLQQDPRWHPLPQILQRELRHYNEVHDQGLWEAHQGTWWRICSSPVPRSTLKSILSIQMRADTRRDRRQNEWHQAGDHDRTLLYIPGPEFCIVCQIADQTAGGHVQSKQRKAQWLHHVHTAPASTNQRIWR